MNRRKHAILLGGVTALVLTGVASLTLLGGVRAALPGTEGDLSHLSSVDLENLQINLGPSSPIKPTGQMREFELVAAPGMWELTAGVMAEANLYNGTAPGPTLRVTEGDLVRVTIRNQLDKDPSIHWHGLHVPNNMDGVPPFTQPAVKPGESFMYEFIASHAGTFIYHPHVNSLEQIDKGLYGAFIIDPQKRPEVKFDKEFVMVLSAWQTMGAMAGMTEGGGGMAMDYNYFTVNGKAFPDNPAWTVKKGDVVRVRIINISNLAHPMHLHGHDFKVIAKDGEPIRPQMQQVMNTLSVDAGETYDLAFLANNPGQWVFHCHELHHVTKNGVEPGGLIQVIRYEGSGTPPPAPTPTMAAGMPGMGR